MTESSSPALVSLTLRMADNALILAQQNAKWCGHAPTVEEDIALSNVALDLIGQARLWFALACDAEGQKRDENQLAFSRDAGEFRNAILCEQPNGDYAQTLMRQYLFDCWHNVRTADLGESSNTTISSIANKTKNEVAYHLERSRSLITRLADGNDTSIQRMQRSINFLWPAFGSLFEDYDPVDNDLASKGVAAKPSKLRDTVLDNIQQDLADLLEIPTQDYWHRGAVRGVHSEHLGHILSDMQFLQRGYPGLQW